MDPVKKLNKIIQKSIEENSLDTLTEYLASIQNSKETLNGHLISFLVNILKKAGKHEEKTLHVHCILTCLQHFVNTGTDAQKWEKVSEDVSKLCELVFIISSSYIKEDGIIQRVVNVITAIADSAGNIADNVLKFSMKTLLASSVCATHSKLTRLVIMILIGSLLQKSSRGIRTQILPSTITYLNDLSNFLIESDDYETQVSVVEILARSIIFINQSQHDSLFTANKKIGEMFKQYQPFLNFDPDCRLFLNEVNKSLGNQQKVFPIPCMVISADGSRLKKPNDPAYSDFWVDFNLGSRSVSFYYQLKTSESWELMTIPEEKVISVVASDSVCQSRSGAKFEAIKFELNIDSSDLSPNSEIPQNVKIYPQKDKFIKLEPVVQKIFCDKFKSTILRLQTKEVQSLQAEKQDLGHKSFETPQKLNQTNDEKSLHEASTLSKQSKTEEKDGNVPDSIKAQSTVESEEEEEESFEGSPYSRYISGKMLEQGENKIKDSSREDKENECINDIEKTTTNTELSFAKHENKPVQHSLNSSLPEESANENKNVSNKMTKSSSSSKGSSEKVVKGGEGVMKKHFSDGNSNPPPENCKSKTEIKPNTAKKRLYSFERSHVEDVVMSSQDQVLSVEIPTYKIAKKETFSKPQPNLNRENISYSYITNKEKAKSGIYTKQKESKTFNFEEPAEVQESRSPGLSDDSSENDNTSSPKLFKDPVKKPKTFSRIKTSRKFFTKKSKKEEELDKPQQTRYSDFSSPDRRERLNCNNTYGRLKPKRAWKRNRVIQIESSDSDSEFIPPTKSQKEDDGVIKKLSPKKTRFAERIGRYKIDPLRDNVFTNDMELEATNDLYDFKETAMQPREIVSESVIKKGKVGKKISVKEVESKNTNVGNKKATKQATKQISKAKKPGPKKQKKDVLEKISESLSCMDVVHYEPPQLDEDSPFACEDLALDILGCNDEEISSQLQTTFKVNDMVRFGKLLMKQVQEKLLKAEKLAQTEREMNFAKFDYKIQAFCNGLYGNSQKMEAVKDKMEKLNTMLQAAYNLHKDISTDINAEAAKLEDAKNELRKSVNQIEKTKMSSFSSIFQGFGGYLKKLVMSFIQGNISKNAITK